MITLKFPRTRGLRGVHYQLPDHIQVLLRQYRQRAGQNEMGGLLAGWMRQKCMSDVWTISHFSLPSQDHPAGPRWFQLNRQVAQNFIDDLFVASSGTVYFIGFWHTHPEPHPSRSRPDERVIHDLFRNSRLEISTQLGIIVGNQGSLYAWCQRADGQISELPNKRYF
ncbi:Mov34/MPN/PAD-1 family protein [Microcoleus sp.]|uniref:Mov34/MPN/PAD-1 family protein n=1 Tax=Microcoleus sp. TaxID=44472 RepID=UPI003592E99C